MTSMKRDRTPRASRRLVAGVLGGVLVVVLGSVFLVHATGEDGVLAGAWNRVTLWWDGKGGTTGSGAGPSPRSDARVGEAPSVPASGSRREEAARGGARAVQSAADTADAAALAGETSGERAGHVPAGRVVDARDGRGIAGARVLVTWFRAPHSALHEGTPPLAQSEVTSAEDGSIRVPLHDAADARLLVHLQADAPGFAPGAAVLDGVFAGHPVARWLEEDIALEPAACGSVRVLDEEGRPLRYAALRVTEWRDGFEFIEATLNGPAVEVDVIAVDVIARRVLEGSPQDARTAERERSRLVRPAPPRVLFTDEAGSLRLAASLARCTFELLEPAHDLYREDEETGVLERGAVRAPVLAGAQTVLRAVAGVPARVQLVDLDGIALPGCEVELALEGMPARRLLTDENGVLTVGVLAGAEGEPIVSPLYPRHGELRVLAPELAGRQVDVALPTLDEVVVIPGRRAGTLRLRLVDDGTPPGPVAAVGFETSGQLVPVRLGEDGVVELVGPLPPAGSALRVGALGFEESFVTVPESGGADLVIDLGDVPLARGLGRRFVVAGDAPGARLFVAPVTPEGATIDSRAGALYPVTEGRSVEVGGLRPGTYRVRVEELGQPAWSGLVEVGDSDEEETFLAGDGPRELEVVTLRGRVVDVPAPWIAHAQVVEQFFVAGESAPRVFPPYRLAPDGSFASRRLLPEVVAARLAIVGPDPLGVDLALDRSPGAARFEVGDVRPARLPATEIHFHVAGLGRVTPPLRVALEGQDGSEASARLALGRGALFVENLRPGSYRLRWRSAPDVEEAAGFEVSSLRREGVPIEIERRPLAEEIIDVVVTDSFGVPLPGARASPPVLLPSHAELLVAREPGGVLVRVRPRGTTRFALGAGGFLPATVEVPPGGMVPRTVRLYRGARARGILEDVDGRRADGGLLISWEPLTESYVRHGAPVEVEVALGRFEVDGLPPLPLRYRFDARDGSGAVLRELALSETDDVHDLGTLRLGEVRVISGRVVRPDGSPAAGAEVAIIPRASSFRFPLRARFDLARAEHYVHSDGEGSFRFVGLARDLDPEAVLVARAAGFGDGVEDPFERDRDEHVLVLEHEAILNLDVGYRDGDPGHEFYKFALSYTSDPADPEAWVELGDIVPELFGLHRASGIEPGLYRLRWGLRDVYEPLPALWEEVEVLPGTESSIALRIDGAVLSGRAYVNKHLVERGWVLLTDEPGTPSSTRVGRILGGRYVLVDPPRSMRAWAAVIPEESPQPVQNLARGEAVPVLLRGYRGGARSGNLDIGYEGHHLTLQFSEDFLARHPGAQLYYDCPVWSLDRFQNGDGVELIEEPRVTFFLLPPGLHTISVRSARGSLLHSRVIDLRDDFEVRVR